MSDGQATGYPGEGDAVTPPERGRPMWLEGLEAYYRANYCGWCGEPNEYCVCRKLNEERQQ